MTAKRRILVVDDDDTLRTTLADQIAMHEDWEIAQAAIGAEALEAVRGATFDAIILDIALPDMDGREVCRILRREGVACPVIVLTAASSDADAILALDAGANDYVVKPFRLGVLLARMRAQLRQYQSSADATFTVGPFVYRPGSRVLVERSGGREVALSDTENLILRQLCRASGTAVTRQELYEQIWGFQAPLDTHTLQTHVYRLRRKMERDPSRPRLIVSERQGYRLVP